MFSSTSDWQSRLPLFGYAIALATLLLTGAALYALPALAIPPAALLGAALLQAGAFAWLLLRARGRPGPGRARPGAQPRIKAQALQSAIFNSAHFSSIATDAGGVIQIFNVGAERMLGYQAADVVDRLTPADLSEPGEVVARAEDLSAQSGAPIAAGFEALAFKASRGIEDIYELTYIRKDGSRLPAIVSVTALRDAAEKIIGYLLIGTDNTARKRVEAAQALLDQRLRDQQFYTRSLIESNVDALMTTDTRGILSDVNQQMELLTGCTRDELIGAPFKDFFTDPARAETGIKRVLLMGKVTNYELTARARDGRHTVVSYNASTFHDRERNLLGVFASARDVTERKQFEAELQESNIALELARAAADKANQAKSDFLSSMSHELRAPLNGVLGFAQLLASETPAPSRSQLRSINQILKGGWYLLGLINDILDLALIEAGKVTISAEPMGLSDALADCYDLVRPQALGRAVALRFPDTLAPCYVHADRTRVKQVMINLLSNAIKYNRQDGTVTVTCAAGGPGMRRVTVSDTGAGLTPEQLSHLFEPFNRLGQESGVQEGTGIGLVITRRLVELMGGRIGVDSVPGRGSQFWFELPACEAPRLAPLSEVNLEALARVMPLATPAQRTLLYVEDNPANLLLVEELVGRRADLKLLTAIDAHLGIALARAYQPALILMDINLPGLSGFGALRALQGDPRTEHIPVLALSANVGQHDIERGLKAGFLRYLTKPINIAEFMLAIDAALRHGQQPGQPRDDLPLAKA